MKKNKKDKSTYHFKMGQLNRFTVWVLCLSPIWFFTACVEAEEGCLDAAALDFTVSVDEACSDCCTYPEFSLALLHKAIQGDDTLNLNYNTSFTNDLGQAFAFQSISYYLSNVHMIKESDARVLVNERLDLATAVNGTDTSFTEIEDNFALLDPSDFQDASIGTIRESGTVSQLQFTLGLEELIQSTQPDYLSEDHPLAEQDPSMYSESLGRYLYNRIAFYRDANLEESTLEVIEITDEENLIPVTLDLGVEIPVGSNVEITLEIDYLSWFSTVDTQNDPVETIKSKIVSNLAQSFRVFEVSFSQ